MLKNHRLFKTTFIFGLLLFSLLATVISINSKASPIYNARIELDLQWSIEELLQKPIIPRHEVKKVNLTVIFRVVIAKSFGQGIWDAYEPQNKYGIIDLEIVDKSTWCSAVLESPRIVITMKKEETTNTSIYMTINEDAPAYGEGFIKIKLTAAKLGALDGYENEYTLNFVPSYLPIIKTTLPNANTKIIDPSKNAVFPIEIENIGNARTKVLFKVENVPENWQAVVTDEVILGETKGSKATAYLTVIPPRGAGYHYEEANIRVVMTPVRAENPDERGTPLYATFIVQNRGFSTSGIEVILPLVIILIVIIAIILLLIKRMRTKKDKTVR